MKSYNALCYPGKSNQFTFNYSAKGGMKGAIHKLRDVCQDDKITFKIIELD